MKNFNIFTYSLLLFVGLQQTACNTYSPEQVLPQQGVQARTGGGGALIILEDPCALPTYNTETYTTTSSSQGCINVNMQLSAVCVDVAIAYKPTDESTWEGILIEGAYSNNTVTIRQTLPCLNTSTDYDVKLIALPEGEADDVHIGSTTTGCTNCE